MNSHRKRAIISLLTVMLTAIATMAYNITGWVKDPEGELLAQASVRLLKPDSTFVKAVVTDNDGKFSLKGINSGNYIVEATYIGYRPTGKDVSVKSSNVSVDTLVLNEASIALREVVVKGVRTEMKVKEDTVEFNAEAYKTQPNAVVEDLLKRLPGVEVGTDGSITSNGKTVTKILIEGKEFFADDPKVASKNLPVDMIEKLQVVDRKSDLARMTGVDDGEDETVINLVVKKNMKNGWFGSAEGGYGTDERYKGGFNINRMANDNQFTLLGNFNNINEEGFTDSNGNRFRRFGGTNGINTNQAIGANFNVGKGEILRVGGNVLYSHTNRLSISDIERQNLMKDSTSYRTQHTDARDRGHNFRIDLRVQWKPDSFNTLDFRPNISLNYNDSEQSDSTLLRDGLLRNVNRSINMSQSDGHSFEGGAALIFNHNFRRHRGRSFSVHARYSHSNVHETENSYSHAYFWQRLPFVLSDSIDLDDQVMKNHTWNHTAMTRLTWTEPLGNVKNGRFLTFSYRLQYRWNDADRLTYEHPVLWPDGFSGEPVIKDQLVLNDTLSNRFRNDYFNQNISVGFKQVKSAYTLDAGIGVTPQMSKSEDLIIAERSIPAHWVWNLAPYLRYRHKFSKTRSFNANYNGRSSQPSMSQLQPVPDMSNPLNIIVGNPSLDPSFNHNVMMRFQDFNTNAQRSIMAMAFIDLTQNSIVSKTTNTSNGGQITTYENVNGVWSGRAMLMISQPLGRKGWSISNNIFANYSQRIGFVDGSRNRSGQLGLNEMFTIAFRPENFEFELRPYYRYSVTKNTIQSNRNGTTEIHTYGGNFNVTGYLPLGFVIGTDVTYTGSKGYSTGFDQNEWIWNATLSYQTLADKSLTISIKGYDLLNKRSSVRQTVSDTYIEDTRSNTLSRYFMATVAWKFNTFGGKRPQSRNDFNGPGGPGGPGRFGPPGGGGGGRRM